MAVQPLMLEILLGSPYQLIDPANVVSIINQNDFGFPRGLLAAKRLTSGQEVAEQPVKGRGPEGRQTAKTACSCQ